MKKISLLILGFALAAFPSCMNQGAQSDSSADTIVLTKEEQLLMEQLKFNIENLVESAQHLKAAPFISKKDDGSVELTEKEKMVKPDYLYSFTSTSELVDLSQKYRAVAILGVDKVIAEKYGMPTEGYSAAIGKLVIEIGDPAFTKFATTVWEEKGPVNEALSALVDGEYNAERQKFFWEFIAAGLVEQTYVLTENMEKFMPMFDDQTASDLTFNFVCVHYGILEMTKLYEEMATLHEVLDPLYVINATSKAELEKQLIELKDTIKEVRQKLLK